ncbi:MAG: sulfatase-like hydrolase/transferase, partial [Planctomycetaceae bacterium]|nr:sulfatase-like hydrolase/transferase [Planctomycetaceae bacterium]
MQTLTHHALKILLLVAALGITTPLLLADSKPSIIIIYTDDQGYGDASCLNAGAKFQTPNIDRLAREGLTFTDGHCSDTVCTPSRYGLLTGRYSWRTELKRGVFGAERTCLIPNDRLTI